MNLPLDSAVNRLQASATYSSYFLTVFHEKPTLKNLGLAIALFEKTLDTYNTPFDDWQVSDNDSLVSPSARRGFALFNGKAKCSTCHFGGDFNNGGIDYRNIGLAPYMHNGMFRTLREVIDYYNDPDKVIPNPVNRDPLLSKPLNLTATEKTDLESFLKILTDKRFVTGQ